MILSSREKLRILRFSGFFLSLVALIFHGWRSPLFSADLLTGIHSSRVLSQSMPWIAQEAGIFKKYDLDFRLIYISSSSIVTGALLGGNGDLALVGGEGRDQSAGAAP